VAEAASRFHRHSTPTSRSWLNVIERWFRDLRQNRIRNGVFRSVAELEQAIRDDIDHHHANPKPIGISPAQTPEPCSEAAHHHD
jgi:hypothetical protein